MLVAIIADNASNIGTSLLVSTADDRRDSRSIYGNFCITLFVTLDDTNPVFCHIIFTRGNGINLIRLHIDFGIPLYPCRRPWRT